MHMFEMLTKEHHEIKRMLQQLISQLQSHEEPDLNLMKQCRDAGLLHMAVEEELLYPKAQKESATAQLIKDAYAEHQEMKSKLKAVESNTAPPEIHRVLQEILGIMEHHVQEEEQKLFPQLEKMWGPETIQSLGQEMQNFESRRKTVR